ncbi:MAG: DNA repair protein RadA [Clostridia bacterium]|nr:DNA repair protein RadA [Clostridia bacterium]
MIKTKNNTRYVCTECGAVSPGWLGKCPSCNRFGTIVEEFVEEEKLQSASPRVKTTPVRLSEVSRERLTRVKSGIPELDVVLGGGIVPASLVLIGGDPGIGKSTLMTQVAGALAKTEKVLYASAEESCAQVKMRCERLGITGDELMLLNETELGAIIESAKDYRFLIVDSISAVYLEEMNSSAGSVGQVKECAARLMRFAKSNRTTVFIVGHVTKEGAIAGPKILEHIVDTVLYFEGQPQDNYKLLRAVKNRFGSAQEVGVFEMRDNGVFGVSDYNGIFVSAHRGAEAGSVVMPSVSGNRCVPVEIQTLLSKTVFGMPRRMPLGVDYNRTNLLLAVLEKRAYMPFYALDVYVSAVGGIKLTEPAADLAIALALASSLRNVPVDKGVCAFGEIGLTGEIRGVTFAEKRVAECVRMGFKRVFVPERNADALTKFKGKIEIVPVGHIYGAIKLLFGEDGKPFEVGTENSDK